MMFVILSLSKYNLFNCKFWYKTSLNLLLINLFLFVLNDLWKQIFCLQNIYITVDDHDHDSDNKVLTTHQRSSLRVPCRSTAPRRPTSCRQSWRWAAPGCRRRDSCTALYAAPIRFRRLRRRYSWAGDGRSRTSLTPASASSRLERPGPASRPGSGTAGRDDRTAIASTGGTDPVRSVVCWRARYRKLRDHLRRLPKVWFENVNT